MDGKSCPCRLASAAKSVALSNGVDTPVVGPSPRRKSITFSTRISNSDGTPQLVSLSNKAISGRTDEAIVASISAAGIGLFTFIRDIHGDCVTREWHGLVGASGIILHVLEAIELE